MMRVMWFLSLALALALGGGKTSNVNAAIAGDLVSLVGVLCDSEALVDVDQCIIRVRDAIEACATSTTTNGQFGQCIFAGFPQVNSAMVGVEIPDWVWYLVRFFVPIDAKCLDPTNNALVDLLCPYADDSTCNSATISSAIQSCLSVNSTEPAEQALALGTCVMTSLGSSLESVTIPVVAWRQVLDPITGAILFVCDGILEVEDSTQICSAAGLTAVLDDCHSESHGSISVFGSCVATAVGRSNITLPTSVWQMLYDLVTDSGMLHFPAPCDAPPGSSNPANPPSASTNTTSGSSNITSTQDDFVGKPNSQVKVNDKVKETLTKLDKKLVETCSPYNLDDVDADLEDCAEALEKSSEKCKVDAGNVAQYKSCIEVKMVNEVAVVRKANDAASLPSSMMPFLTAGILLFNLA